MRYMRYILDIAFYAKRIVIFIIESREKRLSSLRTQVCFLQPD